MGRKRTYFNILKDIYDKPTASIISYDEKLKAFLLKSGNKTRMPTLISSIQYSIGSPSHHREEKKKRNPNRKRTNKTINVCR